MMGIIGGIEETTTVVEVVEVEVEIEVINMKGMVKKRKDIHHFLLDLPMWMKLVPLWKSWNDVNKRDKERMGGNLAGNAYLRIYMGIRNVHWV